MRNWLKLALAAALLLGTAQAATVVRLQPGAMAEQSELIFIGTVTGQRSALEESPGRVFTHTTFAVEQTVKGEKQSTFTLRQLGGVVGEGVSQIGTVVPGYAQFAVGERVLVFLERTDTGRLVVTGLAQGKYTLQTDPKSGQVLAVRDLEGLHLVGRAPEKVFAGMPENFDRLLLPDLLAVVAGKRPAPFAPKVVRTPMVSLPGGSDR
jgi:hypothetical protein